MKVVNDTVSLAACFSIRTITIRAGVSGTLGAVTLIKGKVLAIFQVDPGFQVQNPLPGGGVTLCLPLSHGGMRKSITLSLQLGKLQAYQFIPSPEPSVGQAEAATETDSRLSLPSSPPFPQRTQKVTPFCLLICVRMCFPEAGPLTL